MAIILEEGNHDSSANRHGAVPRAVLRREDRVLVLRRELVAGVEGEAEGGGMRDLLDFGEDQAGWRCGGFELIGARGPPAVPWESKLLAGLVDAVHLARRDIVAHAVNLIVVGPQRLVLRVEVNTLRIPQAGCIDLAVLAVLVHAHNGAHADLLVEIRLLLCRHIVGLADLDIEFVVRPHTAYARGVGPDNKLYIQI